MAMAKKPSTVFLVKAEVSMLLPDSEQLATVEIHAGWFKNFESARMWAIHFCFGSRLMWPEAPVTSLGLVEIESQLADDSILDIDIRETTVFEAARTLDDIIDRQNEKDTP